LLASAEVIAEDEEEASVCLLQSNFEVAKNSNGKAAATSMKTADLKSESHAKDQSAKKKKDSKKKDSYGCADVGTSNFNLTSAGVCPAWVSNHCEKTWAQKACPLSCGVRDETCPELSPTCADVGSSSITLTSAGVCPAWVAKSHCGKSWADSACPSSCGVCQLCEVGEWGSWSTCSSTCGGGGQYRTADPGTCGPDYALTESQQCNTELCDPGPACTLKTSERLVITEDNTEVDGLTITTSGKEPAIWVYGASNVVLRNIKIIHAGHLREKGGGIDEKMPGVYADQSGAGIYFQNSPNIKIENVHVTLLRPSPNPNAADGACATEYCGPFPFEMRYSYNIYGTDSASPTLSNVYVTGGSTGFWCKDCPGGKVSHFLAENLHGPYPRGQCFQVVSCAGFVLEDFTCRQDNEIAFPEDDVSIWNSSNSIIQRGLIEGGNAPNGVGVISEMSDHVLVQDVDVTLVGGSTFSAYGAHDVTFLRTRAKGNHEGDRCNDGHGYCQDPDGLFPNSRMYAGDQTVQDKTCCFNSEGKLQRCDTQGGVWFAGDYTDDQAGGSHTGHLASDVKIEQGVFYDITATDGGAFTNTGNCVQVDMNYWAKAAATRQEAYTKKDFVHEDFELRKATTPTFCFAT